MKSFLYIIAFLSCSLKALDIKSQDIYKNFLQAVVKEGSYHSFLAIIDEEDDADWLYQVDMPKIIYSINSLSTLPKIKVNFYVMVKLSGNWHKSQIALRSAMKARLIDANKPFLVFTDSSKLNTEIRDALDVTIVRSVSIWEKDSSKSQVLSFQRYCLFCKLKPEELVGSFKTHLDGKAKKALFDRSFSYQNKNVKVSAFTIPPTTIECSSNSTKFCGRDGHLISTLGDMLNFSPEFVVPPARSKWGDKLSNGTWTGLIGDVSRGTTTLGIANIFITSHYIEQVDFSYPYDFSCSTFLTPPPQPLPQWFTLIKPFTLSLWLATAFSLFIGGVLIQLSSILYQWLFKFNIRNRLVAFGEAMMYNAQSITGVRSGSDEFPAWPLRIYNSNWWLFCFLIGTVYRTGLTSWVASSPIFMSPVDTILQLVKSDLVPYGYNTFIRDIAQYSSDPLTVELGKRQQLVPINVSARTLMGEDYNTKALYENKNYLEYLAVTMSPPGIAANNSTRFLMDPKQRFHVMRECFRTFPVAIAMNPNSPFKEAVTFTIHRLNGAGLLQYWLDSVTHRNVPVESFKAPNYRVYAPFSMYHLEGVFYLLLVGYLIVLVVSSCEISYHIISSHYTAMRF